MGYFHFDESIHVTAGFIVAAAVYTEEDITFEVMQCLEQVGLVVRQDEFKSSSIMQVNLKQVALRDYLWSLVFEKAKIGLVVIPEKDRDRLGDDCLLALMQFINKCKLSHNHKVFFDAGIKFNSVAVSDFKKIYKKCEINFGCDSKLVGGIQLSDLVAHALGIMLKEQLGFVSKTVRTGEDSGYEADFQVPIGFELWARMRYLFLMSDSAHGNLDDGITEASTFDVAGYGLYVSPLCNRTLTETAHQRFGTTYLGCIH